MPGGFSSKRPRGVLTGRGYRRSVLVAAFVLLWGGPVSGDPESDLAALRARIQAIQADIDADLTRRDEAGARLRDAERAAAAALRELEVVRADMAENRDRADALRADRDRLRERLGAQREQLGAQVRGAYMTGTQSRLRLLLNQEDPVRLGRMMAWYGYVAEARARQVDETVAGLAELVTVESALEEQETALAALAARRADEASRLEAARAARADALAEVEQRLARQGDEKTRLESEAAALEDLIDELRKALADLPDSRREPFAGQKGKLAWPVGGRLLKDFGQPRGGGMTWRGVLVAAPRGAEVRAVYHGRVAYADWLPGMGLLVIIDHGDGWLSLYGHNEALYKSVGEWVAPGDVLAAAGDSGGGDQTALYFEIRKGKRPENPNRWFSQRLSAS